MDNIEFDLPPASAIPLALPLGLLVGVLGVGWSLSSAELIRAEGPVELRLVDEGGAPVIGEVAGRCWHADLEPAFTDGSGFTDTRGVFVIDAPECWSLEAWVAAPGRLPTLLRQGPSQGPVVVEMLAQPPWDGSYVRAEGWEGRTEPGVTLRIHRDRGGEVHVSSWDLLGDRPALEGASADLSLTARPDEPLSEAQVYPATSPDSAVAARIWEPDEGGHPALWRGRCTPQEMTQDWFKAETKSLCVRPRGGEGIALLLLDAEPELDELCADGEPGCETLTVRYTAIFDPSGEGDFAHALPVTPARALNEPDGASPMEASHPLAHLMGAS